VFGFEGRSHRLLFEEAQHRLRQFLTPLPLEEFLDQTLVGGFRHVAGVPEPGRTELLGGAPQERLLEAFHLAPKLTFHSANPLGPPPSLQSVRDVADFRERIELFHSRQFSVRFPELRTLSPALDRLARALEILLHQPVTVSAFWSRGGMRAPVHYDDHDLIVVQLRGTKRWYVSNEAPGLNNAWQTIPGDLPKLGAHTIMNLVPGDLLYLPRGTRHTVDSESESVHLSIGFTPLTVRDALIAAIDHASDLDRALRMTLGGTLPLQLLNSRLERIQPAVMDGLARLVGALRTPGFLGAALQRRSANAVSALTPLPQLATPPTVQLDTVLMRAETAFCHLTANPHTIDFAFPGGHVYVHRGAEESLVYMVNTARFRVRDVPGAMEEEVILSLASRLVEVGFLLPAR
jgi:bifunctional lysine-specific demethylase and histidyl-hydroxylase MINA